MSRLLGGTLERVCKAVLLLCLLHFLVAVILYFDVYAQHLAFFSRFSARGPVHALHPAASSSTNCSRPNATAPSSGLPEAPSARPGPTAPILPPCPDSPPGLVGRLLIEFTSPMPLERVQRENPGVLLGGRYTPPDCTPAQTVAVIIPFRHREQHLRYWLHYLHPILRRQRLRYSIYVINQVYQDSKHEADHEAGWHWISAVPGLGGVSATTLHQYHSGHWPAPIMAPSGLTPMDRGSQYRELPAGGLTYSLAGG